MALPESIIALDFSGRYNLNRILSDNDAMDDIMRLQGVGWLPRNASKSADLTVLLKIFKDEAGIETLDLHQIIAGGLGLPSNAEQRKLTWKEEESENPLFGSVLTKCRRVNVEELEIPFLQEGWTTDTLQHFPIQVFGTSNTPKSGTAWTANQVLGIGEVDGLRRYVRAIKFTGPDGEEIQTKMVYDYVGPLDDARM